MSCTFILLAIYTDIHLLFQAFPNKLLHYSRVFQNVHTTVNIQDISKVYTCENNEFCENLQIFRRYISGLFST